MVFRLLLAGMLILGPARSFAQIEKLKTADEMAKFVRRVAPSYYDSISVGIRFWRIPRAATDSLINANHIQPFEKVDLDGNGSTDVIFNGLRFYHASTRSGFVSRPVSLAVLSFGKDSFIVRDLRLEGNEDIVARSILLDGKPYIQTIRVTQSRVDTEFITVYHLDTLAWVCNAFVEKRSPVKRKISQIDYNTMNGLLFQENITLKINHDMVRLKKIRLDECPGLDRGGVYLTWLDSMTCQKLYGLLDAIDFVNLKGNYNIDGYDATEGTLRIVYDDGRTKIITDYGTCGTYGLAELERLLYGLTETQSWANADPPVSRCIDSLHSDAEVLGLARTLDMDYPFLDFEPDTPVHAVRDYRQRLAAFGQQRWQKGDIDGNGYSDVLFNGYLNKDGESRQSSIVVLSFGGDSLLQQTISGANGFYAARIIRCNGHDNVQINYLQAIEDSSQKDGYRLTPWEDTLTASDGHLVEVPPTALHHIETLNVHEQIGNDSIIVRRDSIYWYRNDADPPGLPGDTVVPKDSINLYCLPDPRAARHVLSIAAGIHFERLNPALLMPNKFMRNFSSIWSVEYDGGKQSHFEFDGLIGSYRLRAVEDYLWDLKHDRTDWKLVGRIR